jgi:hypothetical protein
LIQHRFLCVAPGFRLRFAGVQRIRLIRKLADMLNGINLSKLQVGDVAVVPEATAVMLVREGWAELAEENDKDRRTG